MEKCWVSFRQKLPCLFPKEAMYFKHLQRGTRWDSPWCFPVEKWAAWSLHKAKWTVLLPPEGWDHFSLQTLWADTLAFPTRHNSMTALPVAYWGTSFLVDVLSYLRFLCAMPKGKFPDLLLTEFSWCNATSCLSWWKQPCTIYLFTTFVISERLVPRIFVVTDGGSSCGHLLMQIAHLLKVTAGQWPALLLGSSPRSHPLTVMEIVKNTDVSIKEVLPMLQCGQTITWVRKRKARLLRVVWAHKVHFRAAADWEHSCRKTTTLAGNGEKSVFFPKCLQSHILYRCCRTFVTDHL